MKERQNKEEEKRNTQRTHLFKPVCTTFLGSEDSTKSKVSVPPCFAGLMARFLLSGSTVQGLIGRVDVEVEDVEEVEEEDEVEEEEEEGLMGRVEVPRPMTWCVVSFFLGAGVVLVGERGL